jgi:hypothetical protein
MRATLVLVVLLSSAGTAAADNQIRGFFGGTFGGTNTFVDLDHAAGSLNPVVGVSFVSLKNVFGLDVDFGNAPGFFQKGESDLVLSSSVLTLTGNVVVAAPRKMTEYGLRPYLVGGGGLLRARIHDYFSAINQPRLLPVLDVGGGAVGFLTTRVGLAWELRRFQSLRRDSEEIGLTIGRERLSFWRASMSFVYRY